MKTPTTCTAIFLSLCFSASSRAAEDRGAPTQKSTAANSYVWKARSTAAASTPAASGTAEVFLDVAIGPGKNLTIQSSQVYSGSSAVAVAVLCTACITATTSMAALGLVLEARWQGANATTDIATASNSTYAYWDAGGAIFGVYAELFNLELQNKGTSTITLDQVTIFSPSK
jgi:hypothetical protein